MSLGGSGDDTNSGYWITDRIECSIALSRSGRLSSTEASLSASMASILAPSEGSSALFTRGNSSNNE